jgi:plastocyanin
MLRKTRARRDVSGRAPAKSRWLLSSSASAVVVAAAMFPSPASGNGSPPATVVADFPVAVTNFAFTPPNAPINVGDTVTWTNQGILHNVVFDDGTFTYPMNPSSSNWSISRQFNTPGVFLYYCFQHGGPGGVGMSGRVTVSAGAPPLGTPPPGAPPPGGGTPGGSPPGGDPSPGTPPGGKATTKVTLQVSDATPARGDRVRFSGSVRPERDGRLLQLQRRSGGGSYRTVKKLKLRDAGTSRSRFSGTLRVRSDAVFRARMPGDAGHQSGTSRTRRLRVH